MIFFSFYIDFYLTWVILKTDSSLIVILFKEEKLAISDKDRAFFREVSEYYRGKGKSSILDTAEHFSLNRNKIRKILITTGDISYPLTDEALILKRMGYSIGEIAEKLGVSTATVSVYMPYEERVKNSLEPSSHAQKVREYREYEKARMEKQRMKKEEVRVTPSWKDEWKMETKMSYTPSPSRPRRPTWEDIGEELYSGEMEECRKRRAEYEALKTKENLTEMEKSRLEEYMLMYGDIPGMIYGRSIEDLERISGERLPVSPSQVMRLHMELECKNEKDRAVFKKYGGVRYGETISRDALVPSDMPLYALHFLIQRLFGWQNSHLHSFELTDDRRDSVTLNSLPVWAELVGILFRSPFMDEDARFWADDYRGGSFKNWMTKKYTGPYYSRCREEGYIRSQKSLEPILEDLRENSGYYVLWETDDENRRKRILDVCPVENYVGVKMNPPQPWREDMKTELEIVKASDAPINRLRFDDTAAFDLLERLPVSSVISFFPDYEEESGKELLDDLRADIEEVVRKKSTELYDEVLPYPLTDTLIYEYDYGDGWRVRITASGDCFDLIEDGRITQEEIDRAQIKCRELYRPVTLSVDGEMLLDDVGGTSGYADFLRIINDDYKNDDDYFPDEEIERDMREEKRSTLRWAKSVQSWKKLSPYI